MPPRKTTNYGTLFESLVDDLRIEIAASLDQSLVELEKRLTRIERRLDTIAPESSGPKLPQTRRACAVCGRSAVARGLCSAHYQQWRYRSRKAARRQPAEEPALLVATINEISTNN
ncbi:MAG: hypothetical protein H7Z43_08035 [Clostridia bacterium]|nr:hypothetical protein [Deltaproteobacteria bacterium]